MAKNIPFFDMFTELQLSSELRLKLAGAELTGASIDQGSMSIVLYLVAKTPLGQEDVSASGDDLQGLYLPEGGDLRDRACSGSGGASGPSGCSG